MPLYQISREHEATVASSQVCMRWRSIALRCRRIWGSHPLKWIETLLDRSYPSSLDYGNRIITVCLGDGGQDLLELVFNHIIDRLRMFNLQVPVSSWKFMCSRFLQLPAPNLEFVNIIIDSNRTNTRQLTHSLFDHHTPNLQDLHLHRCTVDFTSSILTTLTELYVHDIAEASAVPTVLDRLNILGGNSRNAVPPMGHSHLCYFKCHVQRYLSNHPSRCVEHTVCRWDISRECYIGRTLDHPSPLRSEVSLRWCSPRVW